MTDKLNLSRTSNARFMRIAGPVIAVGLLVSVPAYAETKVLRFARVTPLPPASKQLPDRLAKLIAAEVGAETSEESLVELQCDETSVCLDDVAEQLAATELIFGTIRSGIDRNSKLVTISRYAPGRGRAQETFTLELEDEEAPAALVREAATFLREPLRGDWAASRELPPPPRLTGVSRESRELAPPAPERLPKREATAWPGDEPARDDADTIIANAPKRRGLSGTTYVLLGAGGASLAVGAGLALSAWSMRDEVALAPVATLRDLRHLEDLERRGQTYMTGGAVFAIGGAALVTAGLVYAIRERRGSHGALAIVPSRDGATFAVTGNWR